MARGTASSLPPGPRLPSWLQALLLTLAPLRFMEACRLRYGDIVTFGRPFGPPWVIVFHPDAVEQIFRAPANQLALDKDRGRRLASILGERSVGLSESAENVRHRRLVRPALHGNSQREYESWVRDATDRMIDSWPVGKPFALLPWMTQLAVDMTMQAILGIDEQPKRQELGVQLEVLTDPKLTLLGRLADAASRGRMRSGNARARKQRRVVDHLIREVIADRRARPDLEERSDVLSALLTARDDHGRAMSDQEVCDHVVTLLIAGLNPGVALAWSFDLLLRNSAAMKRLREALARGDESYLEAVVKETLRIRPMSLTPVGRVVHEQPFRLGDHVIPAETRLSVGAAVINRRADIYPRPHAFRPERFLGSPRAHIYTWLPFGGGTRRCPGANFSMMEMAAVIRRVLERADLAPVGQRPEKSVPTGVTPRKVIIFAPARGTRVIQVRPPEPLTAVARATLPDAATDLMSTPR